MLLSWSLFVLLAIYSSIAASSLAAPWATIRPDWERRWSCRCHLEQAHLATRVVKLFARVCAKMAGPGVAPPAPGTGDALAALDGERERRSILVEVNPSPMRDEPKQRGDQGRL